MHTSTLEYLAPFFRTHYDRYFDDMIHALHGPSRFPRHQEVVEGLREMVHNISDTFLDPRSPHFASPRGTFKGLSTFAASLNKQQILIGAIRDDFDRRAEPLPREAECLHALVSEVSEAMKRALTVRREGRA